VRWAENMRCSKKRKEKKQQLPIYSPLIYLSICLSTIKSTLNTLRQAGMRKGEQV
jgi:hypothetical protein